LRADTSRHDARRDLPSVEFLLQCGEAEVWISRWGRSQVTGAIQAVLGEARVAAEGGQPAADPQILLERVLRRLESDGPALRALVNATGVVLHTNLGRAPLAPEAVRAASQAAGSYSSLEYDLLAGDRGDRYEHCADLLCRLTGSESSLAVNNNAAAVSLVINTLARGREVLISRGELVEIGGGFRIPEVIERSGAYLVAVGTTNRTRLEDYRRAITPSTGLLLKVHPSNYRVEGFVEETSLERLVSLGRTAGLPVMHDLGSGLLLADLLPDLPEPSVERTVSAGVDVVTWSGDKLLGGPQAGLIHGSAAVLDRIRANPLLRAFRLDKMTLAALEATLRLYLDPEAAARRIPVLRMLSESVESVERRALAALNELSEAARARVTVVPARAVVGGGAAAGFELESFAWSISGPPLEIESALRSQAPPVIGRIAGDAVLLDFRTVLEGQEALLVRALDRLTGSEKGGE